MSARIELPIEGMTCASCAARIEQRLNRIEGVEATVNLATERASVEYDPDSVAPELLVAAVEGAGYRAALPAGRDPLRSRLAASAALSLPVVALAMIPPLRFDGWEWVALALTAPVALWCALPFHRAAWRNLRHGAATMDTLISLGILAAFGWSVGALVLGGDMYFEVACVIATFMLAGRVLEARAKERAGSALRELLTLGPDDVAVITDDGERRVPVSELGVGDRFVVRPGERVAADGVVELGSSALDRSLLTGESVPVEVAPGDEVAGGTVNAGGRLVVRATRVGADTALARIARLVAEAQSGKAPVQRLADRVSAVFVPVVIAIAAGTALVWALTGATAAHAFTAGVAVLVVACPCALGLATPTALLVGTGRGARLGILIRGPEVLESTRRADTILLDKTGTVTTGRLRLTGIVLNGADMDEALRLAGAAADASEHPVARTIAAAARGRLGVLPVPDAFVAHPGLGFEAVVEGRRVVVGRPAHLVERGLAVPPGLENASTAAGWDGRARIAFTVADTVKPTSAEAISLLRDLGLRPVLVTGDTQATAEAVAAEVGIDDVVAGVLPQGKLVAVRDLQARGHVVAMAGDGVNDAAALAASDLGLAIGGGSDVAVEASDLTLVSGDLRTAADAIRLSRRTLRTIQENLGWAFGYNAVMIPLAATGYLNPMIAAAAMALSSLAVVGNSLRLRRFTVPARSVPPR